MDASAVAYPGQLLGCPAGAVSAVGRQINAVIAVGLPQCTTSCSCIAAAPMLSQSSREALAGEGQGCDVQALPQGFSEACVPHHAWFGVVLLR